MSNATEARRLLRSHRYGALSTLSKKLTGYPFASITPYMVDHDGSLLILISALAEHTKNIEYDPRVSLITHNQSSPEIQMQGRVTVTGNALRISDQLKPVTRYLRHFPEASDLLSLDFSFYRIQPHAIRYIGGVGRIHWLNMESYPAAQAEAFSRKEEALLLEINQQHQTILYDLLQRKFGLEARHAQAISLDCDGLDIRYGEQILRHDFADTLTDPNQFTALSALQYRTV